MTNNSTRQIVIRTASADDADFVNALTKQVMADYVQTTWTSAQEQAAYFQKNRFDLKTTKIIQYDGKDIGRLSVIWSTDCVDIDNIHLLPEYQGQGIGKTLLEEIIKEAHKKGLYARLMLLKVNPAKALYERLGFRVYREDADRFYMRT